MTDELIYDKNTNTVELSELMNMEDSVFVGASATVQLSVSDLDGVDIAGQVWPTTMTNIAAGTWRARVSHLCTFTQGEQVKLRVDVTDADSGLVGKWTGEALVVERGLT